MKLELKTSILILLNDNIGHLDSNGEFDPLPLLLLRFSAAVETHRFGNSDIGDSNRGLSGRRSARGD
ncbi:unnamed protein product [Cuscuta campestris]|uniref:Uncharacterized protein n=1 Tax=Cuscuta campestris TaxID=132261 RepID=A0A484NLL5_9ASTE|nr:unnamed protein product [Cuscuta campestris]